MSNLRGFSHVGLATKDMDGTKAFYEDVLGFRTVRFDRCEIEEGGYIRHIFMDVGNGQTISFIEPNDMSGVAEDFDPGVNAGLGVPNSFFHVAFEGGSVDGLEELRANISSHGVKVSPVVDHDWCKSIYFFDPVNNVSLEYSTVVRELTEDDQTYQYRFTVPLTGFNLDIDGLIAMEDSRMNTISSKA